MKKEKKKKRGENQTIAARTRSTLRFVSSPPLPFIIRKRIFVSLSCLCGAAEKALRLTEFAVNIRIGYASVWLADREREKRKEGRYDSVTFLVVASTFPPRKKPTLDKQYLQKLLSQFSHRFMYSFVFHKGTLNSRQLWDIQMRKILIKAI